MIAASFLAALAQLSDRRFLHVLLKGVGLAVLFLAGFIWLTMALFGWLADTQWALGGVVQTVVGWSLLAVMVFLAGILMVPVASTMTSFFLDDVADAVEDKHYPQLPPYPRASFSDSLNDTFRFLGVMILANLLALIFYVLFTPFAPFIFIALNGYLLGREYFTLAAMRREGRAGAASMRRKYRFTIWAAGILMTIPLSLPLIGLVIPVLGAATFTHLYHRLRASTSG